MDRPPGPGRLGLGSLKKDKRREPLEAFGDRCQTRANVVARQVPVEKWYGLIPDSTVSDAEMDRLVHNVHKIALQGVSCGELLHAGGEKGGKAAAVFLG